MFSKNKIFVNSQLNKNELTIYQNVKGIYFVRDEKKQKKHILQYKRIYGRIKCSRQINEDIYWNVQKIYSWKVRKREKRKLDSIISDSIYDSIVSDSIYDSMVSDSIYDKMISDSIYDSMVSDSIYDSM